MPLTLRESGRVFIGQRFSVGVFKGSHEIFEGAMGTAEGGGGGGVESGVSMSVAKVG